MRTNAIRELIAATLRSAPPEPEAQADALLSALADAGLSIIALDQDDEPLTEADLEEVREGREAIARGDYVTWEQLKAELNL